MPEAHVDILCVVDGESLLRDFPRTKDISDTGTGECDRKVFHGAEEIQNYCRMITRDGSAGSKDDKSRRGALNHHTVDAALVVRAKLHDVVRWRATSLTVNDEYLVDITGFYGFDHEICDTPEPQDTLDPVETLWTTTVRNSGPRDSYWLKFKVVDRNTKEEAYFDWDPGIQVGG